MSGCSEEVDQTHCDQEVSSEAQQVCSSAALVCSSSKQRHTTHITGHMRKKKNERERLRIKRKADHLNQLQKIIRSSELISADEKKKRLTEVCSHSINFYILQETSPFVPSCRYTLFNWQPS